MIAQGLMTEFGMPMIELSKQTGTSEALINVQNSVVPDDPQKLLNKNKTAKKNFAAFQASSKRIILEWILIQSSRKQGRNCISYIQQIHASYCVRLIGNLVTLRNSCRKAIR